MTVQDRSTIPERSPLRVLRKQPRAERIVSLLLGSTDGRRLPDWASGAHIDVFLPGDRVRQYSLCGNRRDPFTYEIGVLRELDGRGGSAYIHDQLSEGDLVEAGGPRNNFRLGPAESYLFLAGGIGITPILAMIKDAERLGTPWFLVYGGRSRRTMAFLDDLTAYGDRVRVIPEDECGLPHFADEIGDQPEHAKVYACGPTPMLTAVEAAAASLPPGALRMERFTPKQVPAPVRDAPFEVHLARRGVTVRVDPDTTVLQAMSAAGVPVLSSCRQGTCGTCETPVLEGIPDHRDSLLSEAERASCSSMFVCVSRSCGDRLVLDA